MAERQLDNSAKPGDLIEVFRGTYQHWAVYIGGFEVVHLVVPEIGDDSNPFGNMLMMLDSSKARVQRDKISEMVGVDRFHINNLLDDEYEPRERDIIVRDACRMVGQELPYSVTYYNCEHFVTELRYGKPESRQVKSAALFGGVALAGVGIMALGAILLLKNDDNKNKRKHHEWQ